MSLLSFFSNKKPTASLAKERLQIILAHERTGRNAGSAPDYLPRLQKELMEVLARYVKVNPSDVQVAMERQGNLDVLDIKIELPEA